jgi:hypothetical protein
VFIELTVCGQGCHVRRFLWRRWWKARGGWAGWRRIGATARQGIRAGGGGGGWELKESERRTCDCVGGSVAQDKYIFDLFFMDCFLSALSPKDRLIWQNLFRSIPPSWSIFPLFFPHPNPPVLNFSFPFILFFNSKIILKVFVKSFILKVIVPSFY